ARATGREKSGPRPRRAERPLQGAAAPDPRPHQSGPSDPRSALPRTQRRPARRHRAAPDRPTQGRAGMIVGTAGHIDHGKTLLVKAVTGIDTDRLKEEKARGITIELGFAYMPLDDGSVLGFIDVPGHERFVHTMLAGATGIDFVLLIVAADDG